MRYYTGLSRSRRRGGGFGRVETSLVLFPLSLLFEFHETPIGTASTVLQLRKTKIRYVNFFTAVVGGGGEMVEPTKLRSMNGHEPF